MHWRKVLLWTLSAAILTAPVYLSGINVTAAPIMQENKTEVDKIKEEKKEPVSGYEEEFQKNNRPSGTGYGSDGCAVSRRSGF